MTSNGPAFYDDDAVLATYMRSRQRPDNPNDTLEKPILLDLIGAVESLHILDLGCGDAAIGRDMLATGAAAYIGIDGSHNMIALAEHMLDGTPGRAVLHTMEEWSYPSAVFDLVLARLAIHYVADLSRLCSQVHGALRPGGRFIFSVEHPIVTSCDRGWAPGSARQDWLVDGYFDTGPRINAWLGGTVRKYHRTVEEYFRTLQDTGFVVEHLRESCPRRVHFQDASTYERRRRIPLFLFLAGRK